jgi:hypothetical protein
MNKITVRRKYLPETVYKNHIVTLDASQLSSQVFNCPSRDQVYCFWEARPFNFADLDGPVPASVYFANKQSDGALFNGRLQNTIVDGNYWPILSLPKAITSVAPDLFASCKIRYQELDATYTQTFVGEDGKQSSTTFFSAHPGIWDPPIKLQPIEGTLKRPTLAALTRDSLIYPTASLAAEQHRSIHTPVITPAASHPTGHFMESAAPRGPILATGSSDKLAPSLTTMTSKFTTSALPGSLVTKMGSRTLSFGGPALTLEDSVISRASNGDYIISSFRVYDLRSSTYRNSPFIGSMGDQTNADGTLPAQLSSTGIRTIGSVCFQRWICVFSFLIVIIIV